MILVHTSLSDIANLATVIAMIFAYCTYLNWKDHFKKQKSHEYALDLLKKLRRLQYEIENLGRAKDMTLPSEDHEKILRSILERITPLYIDIQIDFLLAENTLIKHKNISSEFTEGFKTKILKPVHEALYNYEQTHGGEPANDAELYGLFLKGPNLSYSELLKGLERHDEAFFKDVDELFSNVCKKVQANLLNTR